MKTLLPITAILAVVLTAALPRRSWGSFPDHRAACRLGRGVRGRNKVGPHAAIRSPGRDSASCAGSRRADRTLETSLPVRYRVSSPRASPSVAAASASSSGFRSGLAFWTQGWSCRVLARQDPPWGGGIRGNNNRMTACVPARSGQCTAIDRNARADAPHDGCLRVDCAGGHR
jgi:hypothetical protein